MRSSFEVGTSKNRKGLTWGSKVKLTLSFSDAIFPRGMAGIARLSKRENARVWLRVQKVRLLSLTNDGYEKIRLHQQKVEGILEWICDHFNPNGIGVAVPLGMIGKKTWMNYLLVVLSWNKTDSRIAKSEKNASCILMPTCIVMPVAC